MEARFFYLWSGGQVFLGPPSGRLVFFTHSVGGPGFFSRHVFTKCVQKHFFLYLRVLKTVAPNKPESFCCRGDTSEEGRV